MITVLVIIYLLLGRVLPWSLAVTIALVNGRRQQILPGLIISGVLGLIEDIVRVRPLGLTSLLLVTLTAGVWLIETRFRPRFAWWWMIAAVLGEFLIHWIQRRQDVTIMVVLGQIGMLVFMLWWMRRAKESEGIYVER